jgi:L-alanine-DL-glutamate epimerase-like enolase superfamily enzyme
LILPISEIYGGAAGFLEDCRTLIIRVETDNGCRRLGAKRLKAGPGNTYETLETMDIMVRKYFAPALVGMNLEDTGAVSLNSSRRVTATRFTKAGIEIALYDALAKFYNVPVYRLLGGPYRKRSNWSVGSAWTLSAERSAQKLDS